jgi:hypothetical protein
MIATYYPSSKNTHNLKDMEFKILKKIQESFVTCKWGVMCIWYKTKVWVYDIKNKNLKKLTYFGIIQNYNKFSRWNVEFNKTYTLWNFHIYSTMTTQNMWYIGATICIFNNKLQMFSFKKSFIWKCEKGLKMTHSLFYKVIMLAPIYILAPS